MDPHLPTHLCICFKPTTVKNRGEGPPNLMWKKRKKKIPKGFLNARSQYPGRSGIECIAYLK